MYIYIIIGWISGLCGCLLNCLVIEIDRVQGKATNGEETPSMIRLTEKVVIPVEEHPNVRSPSQLAGFDFEFCAARSSILLGDYLVQGV